MSRRHAIAVAVAIAAMVAALLPPLWIQTTGDDVAKPQATTWCSKLHRSIRCLCSEETTST